MSKQAGRMSQGANDFLAPYAPTIGTATNVGSGRAYNNGRADVTFTADPINAATSFTVTSSPGGYTGTGASSPISVTGLQSDTAYTFTVTATNDAGTSPASAASNSITATTVPATPSAPSASSPNANQDVVSWSAPANGGSAITNYVWASSDGKSGSTGTGTSVTVSQEAGTAQTYTVYATNANGNSATSAASGSVTTTFSFAPFSVFGFSPFGVFGFSPFGVFGFSPFGVFGFSPFGFSPFGVFGFSPFGFSPFGFSPAAYGIKCIDGETFIRIKPGIGSEVTDPETGITVMKNANGETIAKKAKDIVVGDTVYSLNYAEIDPNTPDYEVFAWNSNSLTPTGETETTIVDVEESVRSQTVCFNNDQSAQFTLEHPILIGKTVEGVTTYVFSMVAEVEVGNSIFKYNPVTGTTDEVVVSSIDVLPGSKTVYTFSAEPADLIIAGDVVTHNK